MTTRPLRLTACNSLIFLSLSIYVDMHVYLCVCVCARAREEAGGGGLTAGLMADRRFSQDPCRTETLLRPRIDFDMIFAQDGNEQRADGDRRALAARATG